MSAEELDAVLRSLGGYGRYQVLVFTGLGLIYGGRAWTVFVQVFLAWPPQHHCTPWTNQTLDQSLLSEDNDSRQMAWSQCYMYQEAGSEGGLHGNTTVSCQHGWTYVWDREGETSVVSEWDLVCEKGYLAQLFVPAFMVGNVFGTPVLTPCADRWGRKTVVVSSLLLQAVLGLGIAFVRGPVGFAVLQFALGVIDSTTNLCSFSLIAENFDKETRHLPSLCISFFWGAGIMLTSLLAYLFPEWRHLQLAGTVLLALRLLYVGFLPESVSWLLTTGKTERARKIILHIQLVNKLPPLDNLDEILDKFKAGVPAPREIVAVPYQDDADKTDKNTEASFTSDTVMDMFRSPRMRRYFVILIYLSLANTLAYYGISFSMPLLSGDKYINSMLSGAVELPARFVTILFNRRNSRRWSICVYLTVCAVANVTVIFLPHTTASGANLISSVGIAVVMVGKFGISAALALQVLYETEVLPTSVRNQAVGISANFGHIASVIAPLIVFTTKTMTQVPMTLISAMTLVGAVLVLFLPETHNAPLPQTIQDVEHWGQKRSADSSSPKTLLLRWSTATSTSSSK